MIVIRRTFQCKIGQAAPAVKLLREVARITAEADPEAGTTRIYTDLSGGTDRVVVETEHATFGHPRELSARIHGHAEAPTIFKQLIDHLAASNVEYFQLEDSFQR
jgi:hypothetical protein